MTKLVSNNQTNEFARLARNAEVPRDVFQTALTDGTVTDFLAQLMPKKYLERLYTDEKIIVGATTGDEIIHQASDVFDWIDSDFKNWGANVPSGVAAEAMPVEMHEMHLNANFQQMFGSLGDIDKHCWQQGQIINFCRNHRDKLRQEGYGTFFLFKVKGKEVPFVAYVYVDGGRLEVGAYRLAYDFVWDAVRRRRVVVPLLNSFSHLNSRWEFLIRGLFSIR